MKTITISLLVMLVACAWAYDQKAFAQECLKRHNEYRKKHHAPAMVLDDTVNAGALKWAKYLASINSMRHMSNNKYGENLYASYGGNPTAKNAVDAWYNEIKYHNYGNNNFNYQTGHFTQVVWKNSKRLGCAAVRNSQGSTYIVARYDPPGNYQGQFINNVLRP